MADLKYLGFVLTLLSYVEGVLGNFVDVYASGRKYLPLPVDKAVQKAENLGVSYVSPIVHQAQSYGRTALEGFDGVLDKNVVLVFEIYESKKSDFTIFWTQQKDTHSERVKSFIKAKDTVSSAFEEFVDILKAKGVSGGLYYFFGGVQELPGLFMVAAKSTFERANKVPAIKKAMDSCKSMFTRNVDAIKGSSQYAMIMQYWKTQVLPVIQKYIEYLKLFPSYALLAARRASLAVAGPMSSIADRAASAMDKIKAAPLYSKVMDSLSSTIERLESTQTFKKVASVVTPIVSPYLEKIGNHPFMKEVVKHLKPAKQE